MCTACSCLYHLLASSDREILTQKSQEILWSMVPDTGSSPGLGWSGQTLVPKLNTTKTFQHLTHNAYFFLSKKGYNPCSFSNCMKDIPPVLSPWVGFVIHRKYFTALLRQQCHIATKEQVGKCILTIMALQVSVRNNWVHGWGTIRMCSEKVQSEEWLYMPK